MEHEHPSAKTNKLYYGEMLIFPLQVITPVIRNETILYLKFRKFLDKMRQGIQFGKFIDPDTGHI